MKKDLNIKINGIDHALSVETHRTLLEIIRNDLGLKGTKSACEMGECGACTVLLDGEAVNACLVLAHEAHNREILTIEGLAQDGDLHPIQQAYVERGAIQCGFCTPGMIMATRALLDENPDADEGDIRRGLLGNLCRCTGYTKVIGAVEAARDLLKVGNDK